MRILLGIVFLSFFVSGNASAWFFGPPDISGNYTCQWQDVNSNVLHESSLVITKLRVSYRLAWTSSNGKQFFGTGLFSEKDDTLFAAVFTNVIDSAEKGIQIYKVKPDGNLSGRWSFHNNMEDTGDETCKKLNPL